MLVDKTENAKLNLLKDRYFHNESLRYYALLVVFLHNGYFHDK